MSNLTSIASITNKMQRLPGGVFTMGSDRRCPRPAAGASRHLGHTPVWFAAGEAAVLALRSAPRTAVTDAMSRSSAALWGIKP